MVHRRICGTANSNRMREVSESTNLAPTVCPYPLSLSLPLNIHCWSLLPLSLPFSYRLSAFIFLDLTRFQLSSLALLSRSALHSHYIEYKSCVDKIHKHHCCLREISIFRAVKIFCWLSYLPLEVSLLSCHNLICFMLDTVLNFRCTDPTLF